MDAYDLSEARLIQIKSGVGAVAGLYAALAAVPQGKVWTILAALVRCSAAETQDYWFAITRAGQDYPVTIPQEFAINSAVSKHFPLVREGMELRLFPGDNLAAFRDAATAGSTITIYARIIESDLPLYTYIEPQEKKRQMIALSSLRSSAAALGGGRGITAGEAGGAGGGKRSLPR